MRVEKTMENIKDKRSIRNTKKTGMIGREKYH